jgi:DNA repair protein RecN (Recombination protein N)
MLKELSIKNYAIIDDIHVQFGNELNIITGETGAGKSILLGALSMLLGNRADQSVLSESGKKCVIEGMFDIKSLSLNSFFSEENLDYELLTIIRREINANGKSRAFINDTPVNLQTLRKLTSGLIDMHQQNDTLDLKDHLFQLNLIDLYANHAKDLSELKDLFDQFHKLNKKKQAIIMQQEQMQVEHDFNLFQYSELEDANLQEGEKEEIEHKLSLLNNAETIRTALNMAMQALSQTDPNLTGQLTEIIHVLEKAGIFHPQIEKLTKRLHSVQIEVEDINTELANLDESIEFDPDKIESLNERLDLIQSLEAKHKVKGIEALVEIKNKYRDKLDVSNQLKFDIRSVTEELEEANNKLMKKSSLVSKARKKKAKSFIDKANQLIPQLGMPEGKLDIEFSSLDNIGINGTDRVEFLFTANKGSQPKPLNKIASGGELSRIMLVIKSLLASTEETPTLIFDEIDSGISGETGLKVGDLLSNLGRNHQILCITHLPQIASKGKHHFKMFKTEVNGFTKTKIKKLHDEERTDEIAEMLSGKSPTFAAIENARELLSNSTLQ